MKAKLVFAVLSCLPAISLATTKEHDSRHHEQALDIDQVISITREESGPLSGNCGAVVPATMVYEDSHGQRHEIEYSVMGTGCGG